MVFVVAIGVGIGIALHTAARSVRDGWIVEAVVLVFLVARGGTLQRMLAVGGALRRKGLPVARAALAPLVPFDTSDLDEHGVVRGTVEFGATAVCDGIVGPALFYLLFGLPGACLYAVVGAAARAVATPAPHQRSFGGAVRAIDTLLNLVPAPISGILMSIGALFGPGANPFKAAAAMVRRPRTRLRPSQTWTVSAAAGALGLALAGPRRYQGVAVTSPWIGDGRARAGRADLIRGAYLASAAAIVAIAGVALIFLVRS
jgi:adenosylcobinamide-phosphate synthase